MELKTVGILVLATAIISAVVTRYYFPKVQTQVQTVEVTKEVVKNNIVTVTKIVKEKDGSETTTTTTTDNSVTQTSDSKSKSKTIAASKDWVISGSVQTKFEGLQPIYGVQVQRRILGPFYLGAMTNTDRAAGVSIGFEF